MSVEFHADHMTVSNHQVNLATLIFGDFTGFNIVVYVCLGMVMRYLESYCNVLSMIVNFDVTTSSLQSHLA